MDEMTVLVIDTATDVVVTGVGTVDGNGVRVLADRATADHRRHAEVLTTLMSEALDEAGVRRDGLDAVVVGCGPGPFTGLRVGMATGAGFGDALGLPVYGVCSLDAIAADAAHHFPAGSSMAVVTDARRREVYWARYRDGARISGPDVSAPTVVAESLAVQPVDVAAGSPSHLELCGWQGEPSLVSTPTVRGLLLASAGDVVAGVAPGPLVPLYLRRPDAVERKDQRAKAVTPK
ncbi:MULTISPECIES: tRNA (adenosine(37)-N6)-threonylcarbamoyltransferase complex dimerization subunit type 1 TsaB [unclassified Gordonia (in: high G+C Gram-positive bacteria)]|uniref:tRNA (adenosine(37)-N6)-threonylcarbamoyltransferase complex dimerization subunit type 1 TsaB n=1 Tax=unclassified Gordonia (in: high G+C Gram-positive bacteria) TaxID=2657482 RepID=UPI0007EAB925|nr:MULTISPECIES: tRNA (adenosine(37)-N6)-threonylcarbamoyltransferase complex dimerization subunit type 1 TsaB [unclassified Gordonia (in: high G+C Gram-positive bacteria)]OBA31322.1 tRNA N6-adenosine(37)-N6-threonylcarbamoyltransferase complex dimerization subunit TsaB [Gordonia sp. 852002-51296_SCH5728562-b]OBC07197.1 tRNA N6-adenosine(37)-N6-threonylcarbamoyltransferase complex dimerization subunit TsaB [Gordonia sp. 852002-50395_SCH5434458]